MTSPRITVSRLLAVAALGAAASGCASIPFVGDSDKNRPTAPQEGRISILTFEQKLEKDPALEGQSPLVPGPSAMPSWPLPGGAPTNAPGHIAAESDLSIAWRASAVAGSTDSRRLTAAPIIADGRIFILDSEQVVRALSAENGRELWRKPLRRRGEDRVALGGGVALGETGLIAVSGFGEAMALDPATGEERWRVEANAPFSSAPTVANGRAYAVTNDSELIAMDAATGQLLWTHQAIAEPARILSASSPAIAGETVIAPFASGEVVALLAANGRRLWVDALSRGGRLTSLSAINDIAGRPVSVGGVVYAASHSGVLAAIDERTGQRIWSRSFPSTQTPFVAGDVLYAVNIDSELVAINRETGGVFWVTQLRRYENEKKRKGRIAWTGPLLAGGRLVLASSLGDIALVAPESGEVVEMLKAGDPVFVPPVAADRTVYILTDTGRLIALR